MNLMQGIQQTFLIYFLNKMKSGIPTAHYP